MTQLSRWDSRLGYVKMLDDLGAPALVVSDGTRTSGVYPASGGIGIYDGSTAVTLPTALLTCGTDATEIEDPGASGAIPVTTNGTCSIVSAGVETRTLAAPSFVGQRITLAFKTKVGNVTLTAATGVNQTGNNTALFDGAGDVLVLQAIEVGSNKRWRVVANDGVTLSTV